MMRITLGSLTLNLLPTEEYLVRRRIGRMSGGLNPESSIGGDHSPPREVPGPR